MPTRFWIFALTPSAFLFEVSHPGCSAARLAKAQTAERPMPGQSPPSLLTPAQLMGHAISKRFKPDKSEAFHHPFFNLAAGPFSDFQAVCNIVKNAEMRE